MIARTALEQQIERGLEEAPAVVLLGARQVGKTTLAREVTEGREGVHVFDLERAASRAALESTPELTLSGLSGLVVIDEVQRLPFLFEILRPIIDESDSTRRFLLLGSASPDLVKGVSESLAGRSLFVDVPGFTLDETGAEDLDRLWLRGGFPRSFLARSEAASLRWREAFVATFLERDVPALGFRMPAETLRRFWTMLCHYHGQTLNASELARSIDLGQKSIRRYLDILTGAFLTRILPPWHENLKKRQVKSPKVYLRDSGLLHFLLGIDDQESLRAHPKYGASWEGLALEQILAWAGSRNAFFWKTQRGAELDLLLVRGRKRIGFEFKCTDAPRLSRSMKIAFDDLGLARLYVVYPGRDRYSILPNVEALPLSACHEIATSLRIGASA